MNILVTGFGEFGNITENPSETLVSLLKQNHSKVDTYIFKGYKDIDDNLSSLLAKHKPNIVLMFGLASKTPYIRLERIARRPAKLIGEDHYPCTLPLSKIYKNLSDNGIEVQYSDSAGSYWCNYLFYKVCQSKYQDSSTLYGLIHIPNPSAYEQKYKKKLDLTTLGFIILDSVAK